VGLFTAYDLIKRGFSNTTIYAEKLDSLASHYAGGLLAPVSMNNDHAMQPIIDQIGIDAYRFYDDVARNKNKDFKKGARLVPSYFNSREDSGLEPLNCCQFRSTTKESFSIVNHCSKMG
jgi:glycine/D-amino acid oxidase-like deaminating enzyme